VVRWAWLNITGLRGEWDFGGQSSEFTLGALDLLPQLIALAAIQLDGGVHQAPVSPAQDRRRHLQIPRQFRQSGRRRFGFALPLGFQKQPGLLQNPLTNGRRGLAPSGIQLAGLATGESMGSQSIRYPLAVRRAGLRYRHQDFHRYRRRDGAGAYLLLHAFGK
jgi:hypothetical protein